MRPTSLPARLVAVTPRGQRLFEHVARLEGDVRRLQAELEASRVAVPAEIRTRPDPEEQGAEQQDAAERIFALEAVVAAQDMEVAALRGELDQTRSTLDSLAAATRILAEELHARRAASRTGTGAAEMPGHAPGAGSVHGTPRAN